MLDERTCEIMVDLYKRGYTSYEIGAALSMDSFTVRR